MRYVHCTDSNETICGQYRFNDNGSVDYRKIKTDIENGKIIAIPLSDWKPKNTKRSSHGFELAKKWVESGNYSSNERLI